MSQETIQQKRERRNEYARQARNMVDTVKGDNWTEDHTKQYDEVLNQIERVDAEISRHQKVLDLEAERVIESAGGQVNDEMSQRGILDAWMRKGEDGLSDEQAQAYFNTMSTTTGGEGGFTVQTDVASEIIEAMKAFGGMRSVATIIQTGKGNPMTFPTSDYTSEEGEIVAQNQNSGDLDPSFGTKPLDVFKYGSKVVTVPIELLQDSEADIEAFVRRVIVRRLARITAKHYTIGAGTTEPTGIVTAATVGATPATAAIDYEDLLDLQHSVDPAYREMPNVRWMFNDATLKVIRKLVDDNERPLFLPSYDAGIRGGVPAELMGNQIVINQDVPNLGNGEKAMLFGDFSAYYIRDVMSMQLFRFTDSHFTRRGQVGFLAWMRTGGNFLDVGGAVKALAAGTSS